MHSHSYWLARKRDVLVQLHLLWHNVADGKSGWGRGAVVNIHMKHSMEMAAFSLINNFIQCIR